MAEVLQSSVRYALQVSDDVEIRREDYQGVEHLVVPCVAVVEGLMWAANAPNPEYVPGRAFGKHENSWNGRPVVLNHPMVKGAFVSANHPTVLDNEAFGAIFNTTFDKSSGGGSDRLLTEIWLSTVRASELGEDHEQVIKDFEEGKVREVSIGAFVDVVQDPGSFRGESYNLRWVDVWPDHLAILEDGTLGACSIEDGCGAPRIAAQKKGIPQIRAVRASIPVTKCECKAEADCSCEAGSEANARRYSNLKPADYRTALDNTMSAYDLAYALQLLLPQYSYVVDIYNSYFVYEQYVDGTGFRYFKRTYKIRDGKVTVGSEGEMVRPVTTYTTVEGEGSGTSGTDIDLTSMESKGGVEVGKKQVVDALIEAGGRFSEEHREELMGLSEVVLDALSAEDSDSTSTDTGTGTGTGIETDTGAGAGAESREGQEQQSGLATDVSQISTEQYLAAAPPEVRAVIQRALGINEARKKVLVDKISEAKIFGKRELAAMELDQLEKLARLAQVNEGGSEVVGATDSGLSYIGVPVGGHERSLANMSEDSGEVDLPESFLTPTALSAGGNENGRIQ